MTRQKYETGATDEYIITGNDVIMKCNIPSFMSDFVSVISWVDSEGQEIHASSNFGNYHTDDAHLVCNPCLTNM